MGVLDRRAGESDLSYHRRLVYGKLVDGTLQDEDYSELSGRVYDRQYNTDVARRMMYGSLKTLQLMDGESEESLSGQGLLDELESKRVELQKERQKLSDQRVAYNKVVRERARQEELNEIIREAVTCGELPILGRVCERRVSGDKVLLVSLNDIHYGANINNYWNHYDSDECAARMRRYLSYVEEVAERHDCSKCVVWANGDLISGNIHTSIAITNKENVIQQVMGVSELIAQFLSELTGVFYDISFVSVAGNHSRLDKKDDALKDERLDDLVEWYLRARLQNLDRIHFDDAERVDSTMYLIDVCGKTYCGVHGDYDCSPSKIQSLQTMAGRPVYAVLTGHLHHNQSDYVQGVKTVMAGTFMGMDDLCVTRRIYSDPQQMLCVCDDTGIVCQYDVNLKG